MIHENDSSLNYPGSTATWPIVCSEGRGVFMHNTIDSCLRFNRFIFITFARY